MCGMPTHSRTFGSKHAVPTFSGNQQKTLMNKMADKANMNSTGKIYQKVSIAKDSDDESEISAPMYSEYFGEAWLEDSNYCIGIGTWSEEDTAKKSISENSLKVLTFMEAATVISVFEDLLEELLILKYVIGVPVVASWYFDYETLAERFTRKMTAQRIYPEVDSNPAVTTPLKIQKDRKRLEGIIHQTIRSLLDNGTFEPLVSATRSVTLKHSEEEKLVEELKTNLAYLKDLRERVAYKQKFESTEEKQRDELLNQLNDDFEDAAIKCQIGESFVDRWEITRNKQNKLRLKMSEDSYKDGLEELGVKTTLENRATNEMQLFIKTNQLELEERLEEWMSKYDEEMERRENKIVTLKYKRDQQLERFQYLDDEFEGKENEMKKWIAFRENRKRLAAASLIIQSWWRGMMVRKMMGPYKPKKEKPVKAKSAK